MDAAIESPAHEQDSIDDEANFIDTTRTGLLVAIRHVPVDVEPKPDAVKLITFIRRASAESDSSMVVPAGPPGARHEVLLTIPDRAGRAPFTAQAVDMVWFDTPRDALAWVASEEYHRALWPLAGVGFGTERFIARPHKVV